MNWMTSAKNRVGRWKRKTEQDASSRMMAWNKLPKVSAIPVEKYPNPYNNTNGKSDIGQKDYSVQLESDKPQISRDVLMLLGPQRKKGNKPNLTLNCDQSPLPQMVMKSSISSLNHVNRVSTQVARDDPMTSLQLSPSHSEVDTSTYTVPRTTNTPIPFKEDLEVEELVEELHILYFNDGYECDKKGVKISIFPGANKSMCSVVTPAATTSSSSTAVEVMSSHRQQQQQQPTASLRTSHVPQPRQSAGPSLTRENLAQHSLRQQQTTGARKAAAVSDSRPVVPLVTPTPDTLTLFGTAYLTSSWVVDGGAQRETSQLTSSLGVSAVVADRSTVSVSHTSREERGGSSSQQRGVTNTARSSRSPSLHATQAVTTYSGVWWTRCQVLIRSTLDAALCDRLLRSVAMLSGGSEPAPRQVLGVLYRALGDAHQTPLSEEVDRGVATRLMDVIRLVELEQHNHAQGGDSVVQKEASGSHLRNDRNSNRGNNSSRHRESPPSLMQVIKQQQVVSSAVETRGSRGADKGRSMFFLPLDDSSPSTPPQDNPQEQRLTHPYHDDRSASPRRIVRVLSSVSPKREVEKEEVRDDAHGSGSDLDMDDLL